MKKLFWIYGVILLMIMVGIVAASSFGTETKKAEFVTLVQSVGNLSECKLPAGAVLSDMSWFFDSKGAEREIYSVPFGSPDHSKGGCQAGDKILNRTIGNGR